jgi:hypothetical protein
MIEKIVEATNKPVLAGNLGRGGNLRVTPRPRLLCMLGLAGDDRALVEYAQSLAEQSNGDLVLYASVPRANEGFLLDMVDSQDSPLSADAAMDRLQRLGATLRVPNRSVVVTHSPYRGLRAAIREHEVDLVVAPRNDRGGVAGVGFEFDAVLRNISCPLLSLASPALPMTSAARGQSQSESLELPAHVR